MSIKAVCPCGNQFSTYQVLVDEGKGKYCSKKCMYKYRVRPAGLTYDIKSENKSWFPKGVASHKEFSIQKGQHISPETEFKKGIVPANFKGDDVGYGALHIWVKSKLGKPEICVHCGGHENIQWANKSHEYKRDLNDWLSLCGKCHMRYDRINGWGKAAKKFSLPKKKKITA